MFALRILLAWLLLAALPLQGFAAATTLLCGPVHQGAAASAPAVPTPGHHHAAVEGHDHEQGHAPAATPQDPAPPHHLTATSPWVDAGLPAGHGCNLCSAACHGVGLASQPVPVAVTPAPHVPLAEAFQRFDSRPAAVPDKPPRA